MDPQWDYRFPHRREYPEDNWKCTRQLMSIFLQKRHLVINVVTSKSNEDDNIVKPVALAVWDLKYQMAESTARSTCYLCPYSYLLSCILV